MHRTEFALFCTRQKYFEQGERAGKVLAHRVKQIQSQNVIPSIFDKDNNLLTNKRDINTTFREFYQLYTSQGGTDKNKLESFFSSIEIPTLTQDGRALLEGDISVVDEVKKAIRSLRKEKAPGNDGFSVDFYQKFIDDLAPRLLVVYQDKFQRGRGGSMREAVITLLHKKGRDPQQCANYRPISLINVDEKILAKILTTRLEEVVPFLIHQDQVGFMRGRSSADNV